MQISPINFKMTFKLIQLLLIAFTVVLSNAQNDPNCGIKGFRPTAANRLGIVDGQNANRNEFPWQVSIQNEQGHNCGGAIVNSRWVLTAAHCVHDYLKVVAGAYDLNNPDGTEQSAEVSGRFIHPDYVFVHNQDHNDIALLKLATDLDLNQPNSASVCLPDEQPLDQIAGLTMIVTGWGERVPDYPNSSGGIPQKKSVTVWSQAACYPTSQDAQTVCLDRGSCFGDSGGPLNYYQSGRWYSYGVDAFGIGKCGAPTGYTRVTQHLDFIWNTIQQNS